MIISSIIGVSQTEDAIPRILRRFSNEVHNEFPDWEIRLPNEYLTTGLRERSGGIYSWQPEESRIAVKNTIRRYDLHMSHRPANSGFWQKLRLLMLRCITMKPGSETLPLIIFTYGASTGVLISYLVPPVGFDCRHVGELLIALVWGLSTCLNNLPIFSDLHSANELLATQVRRKRFIFILWKDIAVTVLTMGGIILAQIGVFNQCACYTLWGRRGLALPENDSVSKTLFWRIDTSYPAIAFICVGFQLVVVPALLLRQYGLAVRVFLQRDDEKSNLPRWVLRLWGWLLGTEVSLKKMRRWEERCSGRLRGRRSELRFPPEPTDTERLAPSISPSTDASFGYRDVDLDGFRHCDRPEWAELERAYLPR